MEQTLESYMNGELSKIRDKAGEILRKKLPKYNAPLIMAICGSKGSDINLCQMIALVGQ
jgi:DNA-directed RNA polymerase III subunit RPC1